MAHKVCPICGTVAHEHAVECGVCGASLGEAAVAGQHQEQESPGPVFDFQYGENDLAESQLRWRGGTYILVGALVLAAVVCAGATFVGAASLLATVSAFVRGNPSLTAVPTPVGTLDSLVLETSTARPTLLLLTVTGAPPTRTPVPTEAPTATPGPCIQKVQAGDSLIGLVSRCGHRDLDVIDLVLERNNLESAEVIQIGQTLEIPWPTPTIDPAAGQSAREPQVVEALPGEAALVAVTNSDRDVPDPFARPTETLQPGVTWHTIVKGENIISVAVQYGADAKILSELNPEVTFSQCDFGQFGGGPSCVIMLFEGQQVRVPAPTPTATLSPTPSGSETPTPTITATFNAPSALSPGHRSLFRTGSLITLRWVASGTLGPGQVYRVEIMDLTSDTLYVADTVELFIIIPEAWQGASRRHEYRWAVSVIDAAVPDSPYFTTEPRNFFWEGRSDD